MATKVDLIAEIQDVSKWRTVRQKNTYTLYMCIPPLGTRIVNEIEDTEYITGKGDVVLSGTRQETWVVSLDKVMKNYIYFDGKTITLDSLKKKINKGCVNWLHIKPRKYSSNLVFFVDKKYKNVVLPNGQVANKDGKNHGKGDFLVAVGNLSDGVNEYTVINGEVFLDTFDMRSYPGLMTKTVTCVDTTPYPKYDFCPKKGVTKAPTKNIEIEKGAAEYDDFNFIGKYTIQELTGLITMYGIDLLDVVSGRTKTENYIKIGILQDNNCIYKVVFSIDIDNFVVVSCKGVNGHNLNLTYKSNTFENAYKLLVKKLGLIK